MCIRFPVQALALSLLLGLVPLAAPAPVDAQVCTRGKPCGNTCIARNRTCRVGPGTARAGGARTTPPRPGANPAAPATSSSSVTVPEGMNFVASSRGRVYYWAGCTGWRTLSPANLRFFATREEAEVDGLRVSAVPECRGPS